MLIYIENNLWYKGRISKIIHIFLSVIVIVSFPPFLSEEYQAPIKGAFSLKLLSIVCVSCPMSKGFWM